MTNNRAVHKYCPDMDEAEIIHALSQGEPRLSSGLTALYDQYEQKMLRYFVHHNVGPEDAEDLFQESMIKIVNAAPTYRERGTARAWIWTIARNCLLDFKRRKKGLSLDQEQTLPFDEALHSAGDEWSPAVRAERQELVDCVAGGLSLYGRDLPENAYAMTLYSEGTPIAEIADQIGRSAAATKEFLSQCRKKLQRYIGHCVDLIRTGA